MYQSMFLLGILMFGFFAVTFNNYTERTDDILFENGTEIITNELGIIIIDLVNSGQQMIDYSDNFTVSISLDLEPDFARKNYIFYFGVSSSNEALLNSSSSIGEDVLSFYKLGFSNSSNLIFIGNSILYSTSSNPSIIYKWDGLIQTVYFS